MFKQVLHAIRVLDLAPGWSAYAGRLLGDLGAEVIKIETPSGDPLRGTPDFERLNANKYGCTMDVSTEAGSATFERLVAFADVVIAAPEVIDVDVMMRSNPRLIVVLLSPAAAVEQSVAAAAGIGGALWDRRRSGEGSRIVVPPSDSKPRLLPDGNPAREVVSTHDGETAVAGCPWQLSECPTHIRLPAPALGEHNTYVLRELLSV
jgi:crotonobetainyl-CoA:carnitine CoA-transferase CaiB-like acyl-CoA transferase